MSEPTSILTFRDLILEVALKLGVAHYGSGGVGEADIPEDDHDLAECRRLVNDAIRMFIAQGPPPNGWRWSRPLASFEVWGDVAADSGNTIDSTTYDADEDKTTLVVSEETFHPTMEEKVIDIDGIADEVVIANVVSPSEIKVRGEHSVSDAEFSIASDGNFTLPRDFGGEFIGDITYAANTNRGVGIDWTDAKTIRRWRENVTSETGTPYWAAVRLIPGGKGSPRRRWELMLYPKPDELFVLEFSYNVHFDKLVELDEVHPAPFGHDEAIKAACRAVAERQIEDQPGVETDYYLNIALPASYRVDAQSAPKKLGYFGNPGAYARTSSIQWFRNRVYQRPRVTFNP